jgi:hypothetical protein
MEIAIATALVLADYYLKQHVLVNAYKTEKG